MTKTNSEIYMSIANEDLEEQGRLMGLPVTTEVWFTDKALSGDKLRKFRTYLFEAYRKIGQPRTTEQVNDMLEGVIPLQTLKPFIHQRAIMVRAYMNKYDIDYRIIKTAEDGEVVLDVPGFVYANRIRDWK